MTRDTDEAPPEAGGNIIPFPVAARFRENREPAEGSRKPGLPGLDAIWSEELERLAREPVAETLVISLGGPAGKSLIDFLETTGLADLARIEEDREGFRISTQRPTVGRLIAWQALDLGLDFQVSFPD